MTLSKRSYFGLDSLILNRGLAGSNSILYSISIYNNQLQSLLIYAILILGEAMGMRGVSDLLPFKDPTLQRVMVSNQLTTELRGLVRPFTIIHHAVHKHLFSINQLINNCNKIFAGCAVGRRRGRVGDQKSLREGDLVNKNY